MFSLIRSGPKILLIETNSMSKLKEYLLNRIEAVESTLGTALENSGEDHVIIFLVKKMKDVVDVNDIQDVFSIKSNQDELLCNMLNDGIGSCILRARMAPRIILMRVFGDKEKILGKIEDDYAGSVGNFENILNNYNDKGTVIALVEKPLNKKVSLSDLYEKALYIKKPYHGLLRSLRMHGLKYLNEGLNNRDWYELEIRIYDTFSAYDYHYRRLITVLESLELGIILGESWGKDSPRFLMTVGVYRLRFFTFYPPEYIKRILVGLEHLDNGQRIVDYDLYYNRKKLEWLDIRDKNLRLRHHLSNKYRLDILSKLDADEKKEMLKLEESILKSR
jgi:hypothetical protein